MSTLIPFQYAVLRYVHDAATGEFLNVGLVLYSSSQRHLQAQLLTKYSRITATFPGTDGEFHRQYISRLQNRFDQLAIEVKKQQLSLFSEKVTIQSILLGALPNDDSSIQFSQPMGGLAKNLDSVFGELYFRLIEKYIEVVERPSRDDDQIWNHFKRPLYEQNILANLQPKKIVTSHDQIEFDYAWKNGNWNLLQPLSFDLIQPTYIRRKARTWLGTNLLLDTSKEISSLYYLLGRPNLDQPALNRAYDDAKDILGTAKLGYKIMIIEEDGAEDFARSIKSQIESDLRHLNE